jgi:putative component of membrane protein insertase Oxa1/YidC/SpoIIIJ protein YidD
MEKDISQNTISSSKEESIAKAIQLLQNGGVQPSVLQRPNVSTAKILIGFLLWISAMVVFFFLCLHIGPVFHIPSYMTYCIAICGCVLIIALNAKTTVVNAVLLYQKHAPERIRRACLFVPSCSDYMLLAIEKYGLVVGVYKGIRRLLRCHYPNGGEDYP